MSQSVRIVGRISAAVVRLPMELCRITADYAVELAHKFTAFETVRTNDLNDVETEIAGSDNQGYPWRAMVSASAFDVGYTQWTVDCFWSPGQAWIGVGVTRSSANHRGLNDSIFPAEIADGNSWIVCPHRSVVASGLCPYNKSAGAFAVCHNSRFTNQVQADAVSGNQFFRIACIANPVDGSITARINDLPDPITILTASTGTSSGNGMPDFQTLRPCIVVCGKPTAVFRSGL